MPRVSIVMPIYNAQPYLRQCLDSIKGQTLQDIEVLCVNDGSTDDSLAVLEEYAAADSRFKVLTKENGGYGHSMNYGIARATGEFIAIVEPDDFIDPHMYADLISYAKFGDVPADVIKGSFWEFYDGRDGIGDMCVKPQLSIGMGPTPRRFTLKEDTSVIEYHPSIWSALYRRTFLEEFNIRFIEPKGAGWADNPFLMETMICARNIVWVPKEYYYYRQTNPGASSFLKDYHVPFDRASDMNNVLKKWNASRNIWEALYLREFYYIDSITNEFGFDGRNPELQQLITDMVKSMDGDIVLSSKMLPPSILARYVSIMRFANENAIETAGNKMAASDETPMLTYLIPAARDGMWAMGVLDSIVSQPIDSFEAIVVDCGASDSTLAICRSYAQHDHRFRVLDSAGVDGLNTALAEARGIYTYVCSLRKKLIGDAFARVLLYAAEHDADVALLDDRARFAVEAMRSPEGTRSYEAISHGIIVGPIPADNAAHFALNCSYPSDRSLIVKTSLLNNLNATFGESDVYGNGIIGAHAIMASKSLVYLGAPFLETTIRDRAFTVSPLDMRDWRFEAPVLALPAALELAHNKGISIWFGEGVPNLIAESFMYDLLSRRTPESMLGYFEANYSTAAAEWAKQPKPAQPYDERVAEGMELLRKRGLQDLLALHYLDSDIHANKYLNELSERSNSRLYQLIDRVRALSMDILPTELISQIRGRIAGGGDR